jgi:hypothetical protein
MARCAVARQLDSQGSLAKNGSAEVPLPRGLLWSTGYAFFFSYGSSRRLKRFGSQLATCRRGTVDETNLLLA